MGGKDQLAYTAVRKDLQELTKNKLKNTGVKLIDGEAGTLSIGTMPATRYV